MPTSLENTNISVTYKSLLHTEEVYLPTNGQTLVYDGIGNPSSLSIGSSGQGIEVSGGILADSLTLRGGELGISPELSKRIVDLIYPIGSIYFSIEGDDPNTKFLDTGWVQISQGRYIAGVGQGTDENGDTATIIAGSGEGEYNHTLSANEIPSHTHTIKTDEAIFSTLDNPLDETGNYIQVSSEPGPQAQEFSGSTETGSILNSTGDDQSHNNMPPWFGVYIWKRTA